MRGAGEAPGVAALIGRTVQDGRRWAAAEIGFYKTLAADRAYDAGIGAGLAVAAVLLVQAALIAGLVGLVLVLSPVLGVGGATLLVVAIVLALAAMLGMLGLGRLKRAGRPVAEDRR